MAGTEIEQHLRWLRRDLPRRTPTLATASRRSLRRASYRGDPSISRFKRGWSTGQAGSAFGDVWQRWHEGASELTEDSTHGGAAAHHSQLLRATRRMHLRPQRRTRRRPQQRTQRHCVRAPPDRPALQNTPRARWRLQIDRMAQAHATTAVRVPATKQHNRLFKRRRCCRYSDSHADWRSDKDRSLAPTASEPQRRVIGCGEDAPIAIGGNLSGSGTRRAAASVELEVSRCLLDADRKCCTRRLACQPAPADAESRAATA